MALAKSQITGESWIIPKFNTVHLKPGTLDLRRFRLWKLSIFRCQPLVPAAGYLVPIPSVWCCASVSIVRFCGWRMDKFGTSKVCTWKPSSWTAGFRGSKGGATKSWKHFWDIWFLAGGFIDFLFSSLPGEMIQFDWYFSNVLVKNHQRGFYQIELTFACWEENLKGELFHCYPYITHGIQGNCPKYVRGSWRWREFSQLDGFFFQKDATWNLEKLYLKKRELSFWSFNSVQVWGCKFSRNTTDTSDSNNLSGPVMYESVWSWGRWAIIMIVRGSASWLGPADFLLWQGFWAVWAPAADNPQLAWRSPSVAWWFPFHSDQSWSVLGIVGLVPSVKGDPFEPTTWKIGEMVKYIACVGRSLSSYDELPLSRAPFRKRIMRVRQRQAWRNWCPRQHVSKAFSPARQT